MHPKESKISIKIKIIFKKLAKMKKHAMSAGSFNLFWIIPPISSPWIGVRYGAESNAPFITLRKVLIRQYHHMKEYHQ